jgi:DNA replication protein DnaC
MNEFSNALIAYAARAAAANPRNPNDYIGQDGLLYCGTCHKQKQCRPFPNNPDVAVSCVCDCFNQDQEQLEQEKRRSACERARVICFKTPDAINDAGEPEYQIKADAENTFLKDDRPESAPAKIAKHYVEQFQTGTDWLLLCGTNGIGKSFYSACICNALIDKGYQCRFTSISEIESELWDAERKQAVITGLARFDLVVIDDFGAERDTEYMREIQFNVLDTLLRLNKTCIITTNLSAKEIMNPESKDLKRIFSRIYEKSIPVSCKGEDRRKKAMDENGSDKLRRLLYGEDRNGA